MTVALMGDMGLIRQHSDSKIYFISAALVSEGRQRKMVCLDEGDRTYFQHKLECYAEFCGVDVISYSILPNHFYLLVQVQDEEDLSDVELMDRLKAIYRPNRVDLERRLLEDARADKDELLINELRQKFLRRMWNVSKFMQELQVHFAKWYNDAHARDGRLFESLFRSSIVEDDHRELGAITAYIELAAVREKLVKHPADYPFSNFASAIAGNEEARRSLKRILGVKAISWKNLSNRFLYWLYLHCGDEARGTSGAIKRHAHEIKMTLFEERSGDEVWECYGKVYRGQTDYPVATALAKLVLLPFALYEETLAAAYHRGSKGSGPEEEKVRLLEMKLKNFQLLYEEKGFARDRF